MNTSLMDEKKILKKSKKFAARLKESKGIICTDKPSSNIVLCNEGQATGLTKEAIHNAIIHVLPEIPLPKYIAEKGESYSIVTFNNIENAVIFYDSFNGILKMAKQGPPIYMIYVENVPTMETVCQATNPKGLHLIDNFITKEEECLFIKLFDCSEETDSNNLKNRQVKHYGYEFRYGSNDVDLSAPLGEKIPQDCDVLWERLKKAGIDMEKPPDQLTVNKYLPGQGIPSHVDKHSPFGETILALSLGSSVLMDWRHRSGKYAPVVVPGRSMLVMRDEASGLVISAEEATTDAEEKFSSGDHELPDAVSDVRWTDKFKGIAGSEWMMLPEDGEMWRTKGYDWQHGIQPRTWDPVIETRPNPSDNNNESVIKVITAETVTRQSRISLTFRWTRSGPCQCVYRTLCDSSCVRKSTDDMEAKLASNLEDLHVHQVYEQIAGHFSTTRHKPWPKVVEFMASVPAGSVVVDLGCGNGKNILQRDDILQLACERSEGLLSECAQHTGAGAGGIARCDLVRLDLLAAALRDGCADAAICIAVVHHFCTKGRRQQAIGTIARLLRAGGRALITVWAKDQSKANYLARSKQNPDTTHGEVRTVGGVNLPVHQNRTQFQHNDLLVPWKLRQVSGNKLSGQPESTLLRYYHVFEDNELVELCREVPGLEIEASFYEEGNWCIVCRKR